ncbi:YhgE/Pip domain-containing protein [Vagococcus carniphilus]|uniref:YhgE/Pip domain-containing protein n=1 Tax=Vagococcus carniphilus TaxID=218144 RepID=UPI0028922F9A|nr:YhgE/Pip domain-containing protein [Vagococcus carniphilus]MDT2831228.1 YhgE/Pip domain-containing protein [Vagococcus carniphilus]MDT2839613.1 YhgE/Pip domain-containing protein [Vagococcus carniphilus]MDT2854082.1 YhgE/Pip domain-containing protein [Vagococcus carniphilus]
MKRRIRNVLELYHLDWKRIYQNKLTFVLIIALMFIPSLYAWFNIAALWDPYSNTGDIKIAIYSDDVTAEVLDQKVNIGDQILDNLKDNDTLGWQFVKSKDELDKGVKSGKYYAGIYLPKNFSENLVSFVNGDIKHPEIDYSVNQKINAIAPKISDKGAGTIKDTISKEFVETVSKTLMEVLNEIGFNLDSNLPSIKKMTSKVLEIDDNLDEIDGYTKEVVELNKKMPELKGKLNQANDFVGMIPEVNQMTGKVLTLNQKMPEIEKYGDIVYQVQGKIPEIENAGRQINQIDQDFDQVVKMMDEAINEANKGLGIISDAQKVLPEVSELVKTANGVIPDIKNNLNEVQKALPNIASGVNSGIKIVQVISNETIVITDGIIELIDKNELAPDEKAQIKADLQKLSGRLDAQSAMIQSIIDTVQNLQELTGSHNLDGLISQLQSAKNVIDGAKQRVDNVLANFDALAESPQQLAQALAAIKAEAVNINSVVSNINVGAIESEVNALINKAQSMLTNAGNITNSIINENLINRIDQLMTSTSATITNAVGFLESYKKELPAIQQEIHSANVLLNGNMNLIIGGINDGASFFRNDFPMLKNKLNKASGFIQNDLPGIETDVQKTMKMVNEKAPKFEKALSEATDLINNDWPKIKDSIGKASDLIRKGEEDVNLEEIIKYLKNDANSESNFISSPVKVKQTDVYPVPNYGSASTPFYTALCLWVGAVLFSSIASTKFNLDEEQKKKYSKRQQFLGRMMTYLTVGFFQALIVTLGNQWLLGSYTKNPIWNLIFALFIDFAFMMMVYVLVGLFDNLGKGIAIIILVLSISAGGGNFPIEMSGPFFRAIHPYIPFTHAVNLLRESVGGIYWPSALKAISILLGVTIAFFIAGYILYPKADRLFRKINDNLKKGHILH